MMRRKVGSFRGSNTRWLLALAITVPALLVSGPAARAVPSPMRYQNFHASACEVSDSTQFHAVYANQGMTVTPVTGDSSMVTCPITWSLDATTFPLLEIYVTVSWSGVPTSGTSTPANFEPGCTVKMNTSSSIFGGVFNVLYDHTNGSGTSTPTLVYHWKTLDPALGPILYGQVIGSVLSCVSVPQGVVLNGYSVTSCIANATSSCSF